MASSGFVRVYNFEEGWGVIDGPDVPGGCWVHFSVIAGDAHRPLTAGQMVSFRAEAAPQDGFAYRAVKVWTDEAEPAAQQRGDAGAYHSTLILAFDEPPEAGRR